MRSEPYATGAVVRLHGLRIHRLRFPFLRGKTFPADFALTEAGSGTPQHREERTASLYSFFASCTLSRPSSVNHRGALSNPSSMAVSAAAEDSTNMIRI